MNSSIFIFSFIIGFAFSFPENSKYHDPYNSPDSENGIIANDADVDKSIERSGKLVKIYKAKSNEPQEFITPIPIVSFDKIQSLDGSYKTSYETGNHIIAEESGFIKHLGEKDHESLVQQGSFSYPAPDGSLISAKYTADEQGFRIEGAHLPTPPPIPEEIQKALQTIYEQIRLQQEQEAINAPIEKYKTEEYSQEYKEADITSSENYPEKFSLL